MSAHPADTVLPAHLTHPTVAAFGSRAGRLTVGGVAVDRLAERVGQTPFFAYDRGLLTARVALLRGSLPEDVAISYAVKANPMPAVIWHLSGLVDGFDVASAREMQLALDTPAPAERVSFAGPGKTPAELRQAVAAGVTIVLESPTEVARVARIGAELSVRPPVAVRVNPDFLVKRSGMRMGGGAQQFGVDAEQVPSLLKELAAEDLEFLGFHVFAGSQNLRADVLCEAQRQIVELVRRLAAGAPAPVRYVNLGGGFGIPYYDRDQPLDVAAIGANLAQLYQRTLGPEFPGARVVVELGRYLVGECGVYVTRVVDRKQSRGKTFLVVDGGMHHQLAASGNLGQVVRRSFPVRVGNRLDQPPSERATVVGCLCTPLDVLGDDVPVPPAEAGDLVVVFQAGAYGLTASPTGFLSHPPPIEVLV